MYVIEMVWIRIIFRSQVSDEVLPCCMRGVVQLRAFCRTFFWCVFLYWVSHIGGRDLWARELS